MRLAQVAVLASTTLAVVAFAAEGRAQDVPAGDPTAGQRLFGQCRVCHLVDTSGRNQVGPNLYNVFGRRAGSIENFKYSGNMRQLGESGHTWTEQTLRPYLDNPKAVVPQGTMAFQGFRGNQQQLSDVIAYLKVATAPK